MDKKVLIQITLLIIIVLILAKIFTFYQSKKGKNLVLKEEDKKEFLNENQDSELNIIKDICRYILINFDQFLNRCN